MFGILPTILGPHAVQSSTSGLPSRPIECHDDPMAPVSRLSGRALAALLPDLRLLPGPVYSALADAVTALVLDGRIATETRLPSERELAAALQISRATVTAAYDELRAQRFLTSRTGSGS